MATTTLPEFLDALIGKLQARTALAGVNVYSCPVAPESLGKEGIELAEEVEIEDAPAALNSTDVEEKYTVNGSVMVTKPMVGKTSAVATINVAAKAARDRAEVILEEVMDELATNDTMTSTVRDAQLVSQTWHQGMAPEGQIGRVCWVEFSIAVEAHVTP